MSRHAVRRAFAVAVLALALAAPARAADSSPRVADTVGALNRDGFAAFAAAGAEYRAVAGTDDPDVAVSPLLRWYVHRFLTLRSTDAAARSLVQQLRDGGVAIETTVHAARGESDYTDTLAALARDDLAAKTLWDIKPGPHPPGERWSAWRVEARIRTEDDLTSTSSIGFAHFRAPFYARDGLRAVRLDAVSGARSLFLFSGTRSALTGLRARMSSALWQQLSTGFVDTEILLPDLSLVLHLSDDFPIGANESFGRPVLGTWRYPSGAFEEFDTLASPARVSLGLSAEASAWARVSAPVKSHDPSALQQIGPTYQSILRSLPVPDEHRFSVIAPLMYVIQDMRSGAILVMGEHG